VLGPGTCDRPVGPFNFWFVVLKFLANRHQSWAAGRSSAEYSLGFVVPTGCPTQSQSSSVESCIGKDYPRFGVQAHRSLHGKSHLTCGQVFFFVDACAAHAVTESREGLKQVVGRMLLQFVWGIRGLRSRAGRAGGFCLHGKVALSQARYHPSPYKRADAYGIPTGSGGPGPGLFKP
jgi:hypothetical protein